MIMNEFKNKVVPWESNVPQQMPWMSSYDPTPHSMQFGQPVMDARIAGLTPQGVSPIVGAQILVNQDHPSMTNFPSSRTLTTSPVTSCPTSLSADSISGSSYMLPGGVTTTTQSCPSYMPRPQMVNFQPEMSAFYHGQYLASVPICPPAAQVPSLVALSTDKVFHHKRTSVEMDSDEPIQLTEEPPTKQLLSEKKLFKQFGSLQLGTRSDNVNADADSDDSDEGEKSQIINNQPNDREEFNRYVYLLFKDKQSDYAPSSSNTGIDSLIRQERDKLSKAVVLWNPPLRDTLLGSTSVADNCDDDDDDDFEYKDHTCFLKKRNQDDSIIITEVDSDEPCNESSTPSIEESKSSEAEDLMIE